MCVLPKVQLASSSFLWCLLGCRTGRLWQSLTWAFPRMSVIMCLWRSHMFNIVVTLSTATVCFICKKRGRGRSILPIDGYAIITISWQQLLMIFYHSRFVAELTSKRVQSILNDFLKRFFRRPKIVEISTWKLHT